MKQTWVLREWVKWVIFFTILYFLLVWVGFPMPEVTLPSVSWDGVCN